MLLRRDLSVSSLSGVNPWLLPTIPTGYLSFLIQGFNTDLKDWLAPNTEFFFLSVGFIQNMGEGLGVVWAGVPL